MLTSVFTGSCRQRHMAQTIYGLECCCCVVGLESMEVGVEDPEACPDPA